MKALQISRFILATLIISSQSCSRVDQHSTPSAIIGTGGISWTSTNLSVCWEPGGVYSEADKKSVESGVVSEAARAGFSLTGWGDCGLADIRIQAAQTHPFGPHAVGLGTAVRAKPNGVILTEDLFGTPIIDKVAVAVHEFGHVLGLEHEQNRFDSPCKDAAYLSGQGIGPRDDSSIMNYCLSNRMTVTKFSAGDIAGIRILHGLQKDPGAATGGAVPPAVGQVPLVYLETRPYRITSATEFTVLGNSSATQYKAMVGLSGTVDCDNDAAWNKVPSVPLSSKLKIDPVNYSTGGTDILQICLIGGDVNNKWQNQNPASYSVTSVYTGSNTASLGVPSLLGGGIKISGSIVIASVSQADDKFRLLRLATKLVTVAAECKNKSGYVLANYNYNIVYVSPAAIPSGTYFLCGAFQEDIVNGLIGETVVLGSATVP